MKNWISHITLAIAGLLVFSGTAFAAQGAGIPDAGELLELAEPIYRAILAGEYIAGAAFALVLAVGLLRRFAVPRVAFLRTLAGGTLLTYVASFGGALGTQLLGPGIEWPTWAIVLASGKVGLVAIGGFVTIKQLVVPLFTWLASKSPAWLAPILMLLPKLFDLVTGADTVAKAEAAGAAAVAAKPPTGLAGVVGEPRDVP